MSPARDHGPAQPGARAPRSLVQTVRELAARDGGESCKPLRGCEQDASNNPRLAVGIDTRGPVAADRVEVRDELQSRTEALDDRHRAPLCRFDARLPCTLELPRRQCLDESAQNCPAKFRVVGETARPTCARRTCASNDFMAGCPNCNGKPHEAPQTWGSYGANHTRGRSPRGDHQVRA